MSSRPSTGLGSKPTPRAGGGGGGGGHGSRDGGQHVTLNEQGVATLQEKSKGGFICKMRSEALTILVPLPRRSPSLPIQCTTITRFGFVEPGFPPPPEPHPLLIIESLLSW